ncbi:MAG: 4Fe-4S dicluster domain-containing protein [Elusimicrobiota bacterium]
MFKKITCDLNKCVSCHTCELSCAVEHSPGKDLFKAVMDDSLSLPRCQVSGVAESVSLSWRCQHCSPAPCVDACMSSAMAKDVEGKTGHDPEKCVGCWMCIMVCPFGAIKRSKKQAVKCDLCPDSIEYACVAHCPSKALSAK